MSEKYRQYFTENIPEWLKLDGDTITLYTKNGKPICDGYDRIVVGDYGAFIEFADSPYSKTFAVKKGQEYRITDERYAERVKYHWLTINDGSNIKIYFQRKTVSYADYLPDRYYVSVHEVLIKK